MTINENFSDMLAEEVLSDMASAFFGSRVKVDDMLELFNESVEKLKQEQKKIESRASLLTFLLIKKDIADRFYRSIDVSPEWLLEEPECTAELLPNKQLSALTDKGAYAKYLFWAYEKIEDAITKYLTGSQKTYPSDNEKSELNYQTIKHMSEIINEQIKKVNERSTIGTLQCTRGFNPQALEKEKITGAGFSDYGYGKLDQSMKFKPINFDSLNLKRFPKLPEPKSVKSEITSFAKKVYSDYTNHAKKVISQIKNEIIKKS